MVKVLTERELGIIQGKAESGQIKVSDVSALLDHIDALHELLDEGDGDDAFGTEGWRHRIGLED